MLFPFFKKISPFFLSQYNWALVEQFEKTKNKKFNSKFLKSKKFNKNKDYKQQKKYEKKNYNEKKS